MFHVKRYFFINNQRGDAMVTSKINSYLEGKKGRIFAARRGTILVCLLDNGESWFFNCTTPSRAIHQGPVRDYWAHSIDFAGSFSDYFAFGMIYDAEDESHYPAATPIIPLTPQYIDKLKIRAGL